MGTRGARQNSIPPRRQTDRTTGRNPEPVPGAKTPVSFDSERCSVATRATLRWPFCFFRVWKEPSDCTGDSTASHQPANGSRQGFAMLSPRTEKKIQDLHARNASCDRNSDGDPLGKGSAPPTV